MNKTIFLLYLSITTLSKQITPNDFARAVKTIESAADDYVLSDRLSNELSAFKFDTGLAKTLVFTTNSKFHEHIASVDLQVKKETLNFSIYNVKSNLVKKSINYDARIFEIQKAGVKELIHRMVEKPNQKVGFRMIEDTMMDILPKFEKLTYKPEISDTGVKLQFFSYESTVAIFDIKFNGVQTRDKPKRYNYTLDVSYDISVRNNDPDNFSYSIDIYKEDSGHKLLSTINDTKDLKNYFNNLCTVASVYIDAMTELGFKDIQKIEEETEEGKGDHQITVIMRFYRTHILTRLKYDPKKGTVGTYSLATFKVLNLTSDELALDKEVLAQLEFTRHKISDLKDLFKNSNVINKLNLYHLDILEKFKEIYRSTYEISYDNLKLKEDIEVANGNNLFGLIKLDDDRKVNMVVTSTDHDSFEACRFEYAEEKGMIEIRFKDGFADDFSSYRFRIDDFDISTVTEYIFMVVANSYNYGMEIDK